MVSSPLSLSPTHHPINSQHQVTNISQMFFYFTLQQNSSHQASNTIPQFQSFYSIIYPKSTQEATPTPNHGGFLLLCDFSTALCCCCWSATRRSHFGPTAERVLLCCPLLTGVWRTVSLLFSFLLRLVLGKVCWCFSSPLLAKASDWLQKLLAAKIMIR